MAKLESFKQEAIDIANMELIFEDNFDMLDKSKWIPMTNEGMNRGGFYAADALHIINNQLVIRTDYRENGKFGAGWYTFAIKTGANTDENGVAKDGDGVHEPFASKYGYFEARCKVPKVTGVWSAFWMMPANNFKGIDPASGEEGAEIDIFESPFSFKKICNKQTQQAVHMGGYNKATLQTIGGPYISIKDYYDDFHTYGFLWTEDEYKFYVDGYLTWTTKDKVGMVSKVASYMLLSSEIAGYRGAVGLDDVGKPFWCGNPDVNDKSISYDFVIDYVKVYGLKI